MVKGKILMLSDGPQLVTGYATITRKLLNYLTDLGWECHFLQHTGAQQTFLPGTKLEDGEEFKFTTHGSGMQSYCQDMIMPKIREIKPDIFGVLLDTFMAYQSGFLNQDFAPAKSFFYYPSDGGGGMKDGVFVPGQMGKGMPLNCQTILQKVDLPVAMAQFGQKQVESIYGIKTDYIPHAVEPEVYKPLTDDEKMIARMKWSQILGVDLKDKFIIGVVARNQGRKMLDRTFAVMAKIKDKIPNAILLAHTDKYDPAGYFNPDALMHELGIQNRVVFTGTRYFKGFDYKQMNEIYNLMDVFFLGTSGEGFGIPIIEAMSCQVPVLATDYTTTWELVERNKAGENIKLGDEILGTWNVGRGVCDIQDGADKIVKLYNNPQLRKEYGLNGRSAVLREYNWMTVAKQWDEILTKLIKK